MVASLLPNRDSSVQFTTRFTEVNFAWLLTIISQNNPRVIARQGLTTKDHDFPKADFRPRRISLGLKPQKIVIYPCEITHLMSTCKAGFHGVNFIVLTHQLLSYCSPCLLSKKKTDRNKSKPEPQRLIDCLTSIGVVWNPVKLPEKQKYSLLISCFSTHFLPADILPAALDKNGREG